MPFDPSKTKLHKALEKSNEHAAQLANLVMKFNAIGENIKELIKGEDNSKGIVPYNSLIENDNNQQSEQVLIGIAEKNNTESA